MKPETRILASKCRGDLCIALILRGPGYDGALASTKGCQDLCRQAEEKGYMGELRYHTGPCNCGLPPYPGKHTQTEQLLDTILEALHKLKQNPPCNPQ